MSSRVSGGSSSQSRPNLSARSTSVSPSRKFATSPGDSRSTSRNSGRLVIRQPPCAIGKNFRLLPMTKSPCVPMPAPKKACAQSSMKRDAVLVGERRKAAPSCGNPNMWDAMIAFVFGRHLRARIGDIDIEQTVDLVEHRRCALGDDRIDHRRAMTGGHKYLVARADLQNVQRDADGISASDHFEQIAVLDDGGYIRARPRKQALERQNRKQRLLRLRDQALAAGGIFRGRRGDGAQAAIFPGLRGHGPAALDSCVNHNFNNARTLSQLVA